MLLAWRFIIVSAINYLFGNLSFAALWLLLNNHFSYFEIAICCTFIASIFSYQMQMRFTLGVPKLESFLSYRYLAIQFVGLVAGSIIVPRLAESTFSGVILVQFIWSGFFSLGSILFLFYSDRKGR